MSVAATPARPPHRPGRSLERRLPLQMVAVIGALLATALVVTYLTLSRFATGAMDERLGRASRQLAAVADEGLREARPRWARVLRDPLLGRAFTAGAVAPADSARLRSLLDGLRAPGDTLVRTVELWTAGGRRIMSFNGDVRDAAASAPAGDTDRIPVPWEGVLRVAPATAPAVSPLVSIGGRAHYWRIAPVVSGGRTLGWVAQLQRVRVGPQALRTIRELTGDEVDVYYRNVAGGTWTDLDGKPVPPPVPGEGRWANPTRPGIGEVITAEARIGATPLVLVLELAHDRVLVGPREAILPLTGLALVLILAGLLLARALSRSITRPVATLTAAADALARGDYDARVPVEGDEEMMRLADAFNRMAHEVATSRAALEQRTAEAQATAHALGRSNAELLAARAEAEAASRAKSDFLAVMSHELRTPLNAIGGYAQLLEMEIRGPLTDAQRRDLERIRVSQQHLLGLVSAILDMSRIEQGLVTYELATHLVDPFLAGLDALVGPQAAAKRITLEYDAAPADLAVVADREKLRQALLNLLSNAIRHTPADGRICIEVSATEAMVAIAVRDTGPGIPEDKLSQIFDPFVQLDRSITSVREGVGLGLSISRDLVRGMGGTLTVKSRLGAGSCFTITLPRGDAKDATPATASDESPAVRAAR